MRHTLDFESGLKKAPVSVENASGHPTFGTYEGSIADVDLRKLSAPYALGLPKRLLKLKRWQYALVATPDIVAAFAIADLSYTANAFAYAVDVKSRRVLYDRGFLAPFARVGNHPGEGLDAQFRLPGVSFRCTRPRHESPYRIDLEARAAPFLRQTLSWKGAISSAGEAPPLTVIAPVDGGVVNVTQKWAALSATGTLIADGSSYSLEGGVAGLDYTHGYLARHTSWRWAMALGRMPDGTRLGLNLVEGFNEQSDEANENALWVGNRLIPLARARFEFNKKDVLDAWRVRTTDGSVNLEFRPIHAHRDDRDYKLVRSHFVQPVGTFEGTVHLDGKSHQVSLSGVTEDQDLLW